MGAHFFFFDKPNESASAAHASIAVFLDEGDGFSAILELLVDIGCEDVGFFFGACCLAGIGVLPLDDQLPEYDFFEGEALYDVISKDGFTYAHLVLFELKGEVGEILHHLVGPKDAEFSTLSGTGVISVFFAQFDKVGIFRS